MTDQPTWPAPTEEQRREDCGEAVETVTIHVADGTPLTDAQVDRILAYLESLCSACKGVGWHARSNAMPGGGHINRQITCKACGGIGRKPCTAESAL
jgi:DnaJ-class molecular chaperone